ncbi:hypothetical protein [Prauserella muralis]|uniref:Uncharacterized protein n=1 Tax=Prauserella muralis TaxID=588067 RepID=A0A2V4AC45_9PSEU|nr:hypothetical protein [Prauserella muralis]PXY16563.1 hypothetical protein BAY60_35795 [Prauserella muralis]TWE11197.1 hypothetical protein FHX69_7416 [Prauserella muralis]
MTSTDYTTDPTAVDVPAERPEQAEAAQSAEVFPLDDAEGIGAPLLATLVGGMALVVAVLAPVSGVKLAGALIVVAAAVVTFRLLMRRGGGSR